MGTPDSPPELLPPVDRGGSGPIFATVVLPAYNEAHDIQESYREISEVMDPFGLEYEFIFVDDGSTDGTWDVIKRLSAADPRVRGIRHRANAGKASALANAFTYARGGIVVTCDADLQYDPNDVVRVIDEALREYDAVSANKVVRRDPLSKRLPSKVFNYVVRKTTGVQLHDMNAGLKAYRLEAARELIRYGYGELHRFFIVLLAIKGYSVAEVPVESRSRLAGRSKYGIERYTRGAFDFLTVIFLSGYMERPLHFFGGLGLISGLAGTFVLIGTVVARLFFGYAGGSLLIEVAVLLVVTSLQLLVVGLVAEMIHNLDHGAHTRSKVGEVVGIDRRGAELEHRGVPMERRFERGEARDAPSANGEDAG
jgi:glycosyltransferase involved in cell wall biosynthesis